MTLDEALLYDAEWWISDDSDDKLPMLNEVRNLVIPIRCNYGVQAYVEMPSTFDTDCYFNLLIREAISND